MIEEDVIASLPSVKKLAQRYTISANDENNNLGPIVKPKVNHILILIQKKILINININNFEIFNHVHVIIFILWHADIKIKFRKVTFDYP